MKRLLRRTVAAYVLLTAFLAGLGFFLFSYATSGKDWALHSANRHIYQAGNLVTTGPITDRNGEILAQSTEEGRTYHENKTTRRSLLHLIGDTEGFINNSVQKNFGSLLAGYNPLSGIHYLKEYDRPGSVQLTVSASVCRVAMEQLGGRKGAVCVYNYRTGEVLCSVSSPTFDPENKPDVDLENPKYDGIYVNRVLSGLYTPGSTFKLVVAAAALESIPDVKEREFLCEEKWTTPDGEIICNHKHGTLTFEEALAQSCNIVFAQLAIELGAEKLTKKANDMGFNQTHKADGFSYSGGVFNAQTATVTELGWAGIGQYKDLANPLNMMVLAGGIAGEGKAVSPRWILSSKTPLGLPASLHLWPQKKSLLSAEVSEDLSQMMRQAAIHSFGSSFLSDGNLCCKTGTAEVQSGEDPHAWLVGFLDSEETPLAFAILVENGGSAASTTRPIADKVLQAAIREMKK